jgi:5-(carboxyamino)imidazole ribonucleotide synthase
MKIGIVGGGQLGRMLALAGYPLGISCHVLDPADTPPAYPLAGHRQKAFDLESISELIASTDRLTWEFENVPPEALRSLASDGKIRPSVAALLMSQDRLLEKLFLQGIGAALPRFAPVNSSEDLLEQLELLGAPAILKTRRLGYDGKGQLRIPSPEWLTISENAAAAKALLATPCILEEMISFTRELSGIAARAADGSYAWYPLSENQHRHGILFRSSPLAESYPHSSHLTKMARDLLKTAMDSLNYIGVLAMEFFEKDGTLLVNECAPRVHNSGHWTIEGTQTSQFENHLRAIADLPLGNTAVRAPAIAMYNIVGTEPPLRKLLAFPDVHPHHYGKSVRPGRKVGHVTILASSTEALTQIEQDPIFEQLFVALPLRL